LEQRVMLAPHPVATGQALRFVEQVLSGWGTPTSRDDAKLLVTELVTNAIDHAGVSVEVCLAVEADAVRVRIRDGTADAPRRRDAETEAEFGRGLGMVNSLADEWGVGPDRDGKVVWFSLRARR
jgi:anti-sigma regulatory factor (Ser/Thr protein kinase)